MDGGSPLKPGYVLDRYELLCPVGSGGMASVWLARLRGKRGFEKLVAIKTIRAELSDDPRFEEMFLDEARIASGIQHPNVAQVLDLGEQDGVLYTVIEWVDGESLSTIEKVAVKAGARVPIGVALRIVADACAGLHAAHELRDPAGNPLGVVHRDVSPHNILLSAAGDVKVIDFGLAKAENRAAPRTQSGLLKGKLEYMAPEQVRGADVDRRADVWAAGVCLYEMLAGRRPFIGENQLELAAKIATEEPPPIPDLPEAIVQLLLGALARDPDERFESAALLRKRCELTLAAMDLPATTEDIVAFLDTHMAGHNERRAAIVARALEEATRRPGPSTPPPPPVGARAPGPPGGVRVSARAMLEGERKDRTSSPGSASGIAGSVPAGRVRPRPVWALPLAGAAVGIALAGITRMRSASHEATVAAPSVASSVAATAPPEGTSPILELPATPTTPRESAVAPPREGDPKSVTAEPEHGGEHVEHAAPAGSSSGSADAPHAGEAPSGSANAAPTGTWGLIPPTKPTIWKPPSSGGDGGSDHTE